MLKRVYAWSIQSARNATIATGGVLFFIIFIASAFEEESAGYSAVMGLGSLWCMFSMGFIAFVYFAAKSGGSALLNKPLSNAGQGNEALYGVSQMNQAASVNPFAAPKKRLTVSEDDVRFYVMNKLINELGYARKDVSAEFPIKMGSSHRRLDVAIFYPNKPHTQENVYAIVECKRVNKTDSSNSALAEEAESQLKSYLSACINARIGIVAAREWRVIVRATSTQGHTFKRTNRMLNAQNETVRVNYNPRTMQ